MSAAEGGPAAEQPAAAAVVPTGAGAGTAEGTGLEGVVLDVDSPWVTHPVLRGLKWLGLRLLSGMETVGEVVANVLGLNESKFQYVIDSMTEEDWNVAREVQAQRQREEADKAGASANDVETAVDEPIEAKMERMRSKFLVMQEK